MLRFVFPTESSRQDVQLFYNEFQSDGDTCIGYGGYENFGHWLAGMNNRIRGKNLPAGYVRENFYLCYDGDDMIGVIQPQVRADRVPAELRRAHRIRRAEIVATPRRCSRRGSTSPANSDLGACCASATRTT